MKWLWSRPHHGMDRIIIDGATICPARYRPPDLPDGVRCSECSGLLLNPGSTLDDVRRNHAASKTLKLKA